MIRNGTEHMARLRDGRTVFIDGAQVDDVTTHPAYRNGIRSIARLFDFHADPANQELMTFVAPDSGEQANRIWQLPTSYDELVARRRALEAWNELHGGFMGRAPDHVASCIAGMFMGLEVYEATIQSARRPLPTTTAMPATATSTSPTSLSIPRRTARRAPASRRASSSPPAWSIATARVSPCAAPRCWRPAASWPTRFSSR